MGCKTLLFGFDGLDHQRLDQLIAEGVLPNFERLRSQSQCVRMHNYPGLGAGAFWTSAATGDTPARHGRYFYLQFDPKTYDYKTFEQELAFHKPAFWETLDAEGKRVAVIDWHRGPFNEMKNGILIDNWLAHDAASPPRMSPPSTADMVFGKYGHDPIAGGYANQKIATVEDHLNFAEGVRKRIGAKVRLSVDLLNEREWDLIAPCFSELHDLGHYYLQLTSEDHELFDPALRESIGDPVRACYIETDKALGEIRQAAGDDAVIMMLGGPGIEPMISANSAMPEIALKLDIGAGAPPSGEANARRAYQSYIPNAVRHRIAPLARRIRRLLAKNEYKSRRFFSVPHNDNAGCIRINLKGREKYGVVKPGAEADALLEEIKEGLLSLKNADTGAPDVAEVYFSRDVHAEQEGDLLPDIFVEWDRTHNRRNFRRLTSDRTGEIRVPAPVRNGDHTRHSVFWSTGPAHPIFTDGETHLPHEATALITESVTQAHRTKPA
ncbi:alkaline phosphatase family protein [Hyphococcus sp.]|uniref:alkaline phosphatase family protein n=1 Tax=Hyphococcus sp. TaxID=2038636 RepID=UPI0035C7142D